MTPPPFLTILITAVITAAATQLFIWLKDQLLAAREGRFSSLYAALFWEEYAGKCAHALSETETYINTEGHHGSYLGLPDLPEFPKEIDWRQVGIGLTQDAFRLRVEINSKHGEIGFAVEADFPDGGDWVSQQACVEMGLKALSLASKIRESKGLEATPIPNPEYSVARWLEDRKAAQAERREIADEARAQHQLSLQNLAKTASGNSVAQAEE